MQFLATLHTYSQDRATQTVWHAINDWVRDVDGVCYYRHPILSVTTQSVPELTLLARGYQPTAIRCLDYEVEDLVRLGNTEWVVEAENIIDSPFLELEDYTYALDNKFHKERAFRHIFNSVGVLAMPLISRAEFEYRFGLDAIPGEIRVIWSDMRVEDIFQRTATDLDDSLWRLAKSVFQGVSPLNRGSDLGTPIGDTLGSAIKSLERDIALLDEEQHKVAVQMAPGPQRIRGLAGTGKTVVLAMKAANIHTHFPDAKILFTFNTQSLYNQAHTLISKFYRTNSDTPPDWEKLHIRHAWGGSSRGGVYSDICRRYGQTPLTFSAAQSVNSSEPFKACCEHALQMPLAPTYDFILVDEAQDFPKEFFRVLVRLVTQERKIYWAYDELQSLSAIEVPSEKELFGSERDGTPLVSLEGEDYPGGIEKDFVLHRSYRCPREILMLAHGIGLGIKSPKGCVQMLANRASWTSIGYEVREGTLQTGEDTVICRPSENSPNRISDIYTGDQPLVSARFFDRRDAELDWVAESIAEDVHEEGVKPEHIVVISLDSRKAKTYFTYLQKQLLVEGIQSSIPGLIHGSAEFAEEGRVTLSTIHRAKGNEAPVVYLIAFEGLYGYVEELESRNRAFTSISRAKGWIRITGIGEKMRSAINEIEGLLAEIPCFGFTFPDMNNIRRLDASETSRRRRELRRAKETAARLLTIDRDALAALSEMDPEMLKELRRVLDEVSDVD